MTLTRGASSITLDVLTGSVSITSTPLRDTITVSANGAVKGAVSQEETEMISVAIRLKVSEQAALRTFLKSTMRWKENTGSLDPGSGNDIGAGDGISRTVRFWGPIPEQRRSYATVIVPLQFRVEQ